MSRPFRIEYSGAWYHVMNRGLARRPIFRDDSRKIFLDLLEEISRLFQAEVHAYSLMDNHYHLLLRTPFKGLARAMRHLNGIYTQRFNRAVGSDGPIFRGRYKARIVESEAYLVELVRYIHLNPVKAGLCKRPGDHPWTSHWAYLRSAKRPAWLVTDEVLSRFGSTKSVASRELDVFVSEGVPEEFEKAFERPGVVLGTEAFQEWVYKNFLDARRPDREFPGRDREPRRRAEAKRILDCVAHAYHQPIRELRRSRRGEFNEGRSMAIYLLRQLGGLSHKRIAAWIQAPSEYTIASAYKRFQEQLERSKVIREKKTLLEHAVMSYVKT